MNFLDSLQLVIYVFVAVAIAIAVVSLVFSNRLVKELAKEERNKIEIWAAATELLAKGDENADMNLVLQILQSNKTIPIILYDKTAETATANNIKLPEKDSHEFLLKKIDKFAEKHAPIPLEEFNQYVYYDDSYILKRLQVYPYVQLLVISIFIALAFLLSEVFRKRSKTRSGWVCRKKRHINWERPFHR